MGKPEEEAVRVERLRHLRGLDAEQIRAALADDAGAVPSAQQVRHIPLGRINLNNGTLNLHFVISRASTGNRSPFARVDARTLTFRHGEDLHLERLPSHPAAKRAPLKRDDGKRYLKVRFLHLHRS